MTTSGLRATVVDASYEETIDLEIADGVVTTWVRAAVKSKVPAEPAAPVGSRPDDRSRRPVVEPAAAPPTPLGRSGGTGAPSTPSLREDDSGQRHRPRRSTGPAHRAPRPRPAAVRMSGSRTVATTPGRIRPWRYLARSPASSPCSTRWCSSPVTAGPRPSWASTCRAAPGSRWWPAPRPVPNRPASSSLQAQQIIEERVNGLGVSGAEVVLDGTNLTITVPGQEGEQARSLGQTAQLRFREVIGGPSRPPAGRPATPAPRARRAPPAPADPPPAARRPPTGGARPPRTDPPAAGGGAAPGAGDAVRARRRQSAPPPAAPPAAAPPRAHARPGAPAPAGAPGGPGRPDAGRGHRAGPADPAEHRPGRPAGRRSARWTARRRTRCAATTTRPCRWWPASRTAPRSTCSARSSWRAPRSTPRWPSRTRRAPAG